MSKMSSVEIRPVQNIRLPPTTTVDRRRVSGCDLRLGQDLVLLTHRRERQVSISQPNSQQAGTT